jgi:hypothetical protein
MPGVVLGFLMTQSDFFNLQHNSHPLSDACSNPNFFFASLNHSSTFTGGAIHWKGSIPHAGIFSLYFWNCNASRADFSLSAVLRNPSSRLDTRNMVLPDLYSLFVSVYGLISIVWAVNTICNGNLSALLHTLFHFLPITRAISLSFSKSFWIDAQSSDFPHFWKIWAINALEFFFYTMTLAAISFACAGFCIYRQKFFWRDRFEILISASLVVGSALSAQLVSDVWQALFVLIFLCLSCLWYLKQGIISIVMMTLLMWRMQSDPLVIAKVSLSRNFVVSSFLTVFVGLLIPSIAAGLEFRRSVCAALVEFAMVLNSILHLRYFLGRKKVCGDESRFLLKRPALIVEPVRVVPVLVIRTCV